MSKTLGFWLKDTLQTSGIVSSKWMENYVYLDEYIEFDNVTDITHQLTDEHIMD